MECKIIRFSDNGDTTLSAFYIDNECICGGIEDEKREVKLKGETRIPENDYFIGLRNEGGYNKRYLKKYGSEFHKGMLCIYNKPNWICETGSIKHQYILIHTGNTDEHTAGCYLPNFVIDFLNDKGSRSGDAYKLIYIILRDEILKNGDIKLKVRDIQNFKF